MTTLDLNIPAEAISRARHDGSVIASTLAAVLLLALLGLPALLAGPDNRAPEHWNGNSAGALSAR
ncbi:hypothetical protein ACX9MO_15850 [Pseudooceanicola sp. 502str34]